MGTIWCTTGEYLLHSKLPQASLYEHPRLARVYHGHGFFSLVNSIQDRHEEDNSGCYQQSRLPRHLANFTNER